MLECGIYDLYILFIPMSCKDCGKYLEQLVMLSESCAKLPIYLGIGIHAQILKANFLWEFIRTENSHTRIL